MRLDRKVDMRQCYHCCNYLKNKIQGTGNMLDLIIGASVAIGMAIAIVTTYLFQAYCCESD